MPEILEHSSSPQTKYIALQIMDKLIKSKWKILPEEQRSGIRNFIVGVIVKSSGDEATLRKEKSYVNKLNLILVQILKQEWCVLGLSSRRDSSIAEPETCWPHNWPTFIPEIVSSSQANLSICENNMIILKLLSEEIFEFSAEQMTTAKTKAMKAQIVRLPLFPPGPPTEKDAFVVRRVLGGFHPLRRSARTRGQAESDQGDTRGDAQVSQLDPARLHLRDARDRPPHHSGGLLLSFCAAKF